jgi:hypothetical protein
MLYLRPEYYFDNPDTLDVENIRVLLPIYESKVLANRVGRILKYV